MVPIAAAAVLVLAGSGAYVMRDKLFGGAPTPINTITPVDSTRHDGATNLPTDTSHVGSTGTRQTSQRDSVRPPVKDTILTGTTTNPPVGQTNPGVDLAMVRQVQKFYDDIDFVDDSGKRSNGKSLGMLVWKMQNMPDSTRAQGAFLVSQALSKEQDIPGARNWMQRAVSLNPNPTWQKILESLNLN